MAFTFKDYTESDAVKQARKQAEQNSTYKESQDVINARKLLADHTANKVPDWTGGQYGQSVRDTMDKINNREKFTYDLNGDALYQQYKDKYLTQGKIAMQDTMGQAAALTGGYGNSYAQTVGQQAYNAQLDKLNDIVPQLYQMALDRYDREGNDLYRQLDMYNQAYGTEYGEYRDRLSDWYNEANRLTDSYYNERNFDYTRFGNDRDYYYNRYLDTRDTDYGRYSDAYSRAFTGYQQNVAEDQWNKEFALRQAAQAAASRSGGGSSKKTTSNKTSTKKTEETKQDEKKATPFYPYSDPEPLKAPTPDQTLKLKQDIRYMTPEQLRKLSLL